MIRTIFTTILSLLFVSLAGSSVALADSTSKSSNDERAWILVASIEAGVGPIDEDIFLHLTPRLTFLTPTRALFCAEEVCETYFEAALQAPLRLRIHDQSPPQSDILRREDWLTPSDFFRIIRRIEYGSSTTPLHLRVGELGPVNLGNATIVNGYYNVITTDHHRLGFKGSLHREHLSFEVLTNNLARPNLWGLRADIKPPFLFNPDSSLQRFSLGASAVVDLEAPTALLTNDAGETLAGPNLLPEISAATPTVIVGLDVRWHLLRSAKQTLTPYADVNHHVDLGSGLHAGFYYSRNFSSIAEVSTRLEYRLLLDRYLPDYIDPLYEVSRYQYPSALDNQLAAPKLTIAQEMPSTTRHGGFGQIQARLLRALVLSLAYSDAQGSSHADLRLRASFELNDTARIGLFYYKLATSPDADQSRLANLFNPDGALVALEARQTLWGPIYTHGQYGQQWQLRDDGRFQNIHLWNVGLGAAFVF